MQIPTPSPGTTDGAHLGDQISLLTTTGRVKWSTATIHPPEWHENHTIFEAVHPSDRERVEAAFASCVIKQIWTEYTAKVLVVEEERIVTVRAKLTPANFADFSVVATWRIIPDNYLDFSQGDQEMLRLFADGLMVKEVATRMERSESTIDSRLRTLKEKLGAKSLHGLVATAIRSGLA